MTEIVTDNKTNLKVYSDSFWYLAIPYSDPDDAVMQSRYEIALKVMAKYINEDLPIYCPVAHWHNVELNHDMPRGYEFWYKLDRLFLSKASGLIVVQIPGWEKSIGVTDEIVLAKEFKIPILYYKPSEINSS